MCLRMFKNYLIISSKKVLNLLEDKSKSVSKITHEIKEFLDKVEKEYFIDGEQNEEFWDDESGYMQLLMRII